MTWLVLIGTLAVITYLFDKLEHHVKTIAEVAVSIQGDIEAVRADMASISQNITYLSNRLAPSANLEGDDSN